MTKIEANILENYNYYQCFARMSNESQDVVRDKWLNSTRTLKSWSRATAEALCGLLWVQVSLR